MAAESPTSICNIALARVGAKEISALETDTSREGGLCRRLFHPARRTALAAHHWNGAKRAAQLTAVSSLTPVFYSYGYALPDDFIRLISVHPSDDLNAQTPYSLQNANSSLADNVLMVDTSTCYIQYIFDNQDIATLSQGYRDVLSFVLTRDLCLALGKSASKFELTNKEYRRVLTLAKSVDGMEDYPERMADGTWIKSRYGLYTDQTYVQS